MMRVQSSTDTQAADERSAASRVSRWDDGADARVSDAPKPDAPTRRQDGVLGSNKSSRQVCENGNTLIERDPARWYMIFNRLREGFCYIDKGGQWPCGSFRSKLVLVFLMHHFLNGCY
jgi:hypothetical protein